MNEFHNNRRYEALTNFSNEADSNKNFEFSYNNKLKLIGNNFCMSAVLVTEIVLFYILLLMNFQFNICWYLLWLVEWWFFRFKNSFESLYHRSTTLFCFSMNIQQQSLQTGILNNFKRQLFAVWHDETYWN